MPNEVVIVIRGNAQPLEKALAEATKSLQGLSGATEKAKKEVSTFGERIELTSKMLGNFGAESSETVLKVQGLGAAFKEAKESLGGFGEAIRITAGSFLLFAGLDFLKSSAEEAMNAQGSWNQLTASYKGNVDAMEKVKASIEGNKDAWEKLGITQAQVAALAVQARVRGLDPLAVLNPNALRAVSKVLGTDIPSALDIIAKPRGVQQVLSRLGLSALQIKQSTQEMRFMNAEQRALYLENLAQKSPGVANMAPTAEGRFSAFHAALIDLKEAVGTALVPALTALASAMTFLIQTADNLLKPFGGLAGVLKVLLIPMLLLGFALFTNLFGVINRLVVSLLGRLVGAFTQTAAAAEEAAAAIRDIPPDVTTVAEFIPATAIKDAYIANVLSVPKIAPTTAVFDEAGAVAGVGALKLALAAGVGLLATIATFNIAEGALKPVTNAIGHLVAGIDNFVWSGVRTAGDAIGDWFKNLKIDISLVGHWLKIPQLAHQTVNVIGHFLRLVGLKKDQFINVIGKFIADHKSLQIMHSLFQGIWDNTFGLLFSHQKANVKVEVDVKDKTTGATIHVKKAIIDGKTEIVDLGKLGEVVHLNAKLAPGKVNLKAAKVELTPDQIIIDSPTSKNPIILPKGTKIVEDAKLRVLELVGPDGKAYHPTVPVTLSGTSAGAITGAIADAMRNAHITVDTPKVQHVIVDNKPTVQIGNWWDMVLPSIAATFAGTLASGLILRFLPNKLSFPEIWNWIKNLFKRGGGTGTGKTGGSDETIEPYQIPDWLKRAFPNGVPAGGTKPVPKYDPSIITGILDVSKVTFTAISTIPLLLDMTKVKFNFKLPTVSMPSFNIDWSLVLKGVMVTLGAAIVAGFLAYVVPLAVTAAIDVGAILISGIAEGATAGLATPLVAILLGGVGAASIVAYTKIFHSMGKAGDTEADKLKKKHGGIFGDLLSNIGRTFKDAFSKTSSALGSIGGTIINFIVKGVTGAWKTIEGIGTTIINNIKSAVMSGIVTLVNGIIGFFNSVFKTLSNTPIVGKAFEKVRLPTLPVPPPALHSRLAGHGAAGLSYVSPSDQAAFAAYAQNVIDSSSPPTRNSSGTAAGSNVQAFTVHANFTINNATNPDMIARMIKRDLTELVSGVRSTRRVHG